MSKIIVTIELGPYPSRHDVTCVFPLDEHVVRETWQPLDFPSDDAGIAAIFCTDSATIRRVMSRREFAHKEIASILERALLDSMRANDTVMGYPKEST